MSFARPDLLWIVAALPALVVLGVIGHVRRRRRVARAFGQAELVERLTAENLWRFPTRRLALVGLAAASLGVAATGPQWGTEIVESSSRSLDLVLALDVSKSMLARDLVPNRLERQRLLATRLLRELGGDRIGLVVFAGRAYTLAPLTVDHSALQLYIEALDPEIVSQGGSSLASAITQATDLVRGEESVRSDRVVVLVTDGEALEDEADITAAAARAKSLGVVVHTVGVGTPGGAPVPDIEPGTGRVRGYKRDLDGEIVVSRRNDRLLESIARETGGRFYAADQAGATDRLLTSLKEMDRNTTRDGTRSQPRERFTWFVALALGLLCLDAALARSMLTRVRTGTKDREATLQEVA